MNEKVFINLAKYDRTVSKILKPATSLPILTKLLQTNHSTNSSIHQTYIFMHVCIIFILLAQDDHIAGYLKKQESFINKIVNIHSTLDRRNDLKMKKQHEKQIISTITASREQLLNTTASASSIMSALPEKKNSTVSFTFGPDWVLAKNKTPVELHDSFDALEYFLNCLGLISAEATSKTPRRPSKLSAIQENSTAKASSLRQFKSFDESSKSAQPKMTSASKALFSKAVLSKTNLFKGQNYQKHRSSISTMSSDKLTPDLNLIDEFEDDHVSVCSNDSYRSNTSVSTIKSIASFHSEAPKMNSTVMVNSSGNRTFNKKLSAISAQKLAKK